MTAEGGADIGIENEVEQPAPRKKRSIRSHEQLIGMIILSAAFIIGSLSVASGIRNRNQPQSNQITITGSAEQTVTSNSFQWNATVSSTQPTTSAALAQLNRWIAQIHDVLNSAGALNTEISFGTVNVQPNTQVSGQVTSFTMSQSVTVQSSRLAAMQRAETNIDDLVRDLNQSFRRLRQTSIDEELFDVLSGYESLSKGKARGNTN